MIKSQNYPRCENGLLDVTKLAPHIERLPESEIKKFIQTAILHASKKASRNILEIPGDTNPDEIEKIHIKKGKDLFKYFKKYCGDPAATSHQIHNKNYFDVGKEQFRNRTLQKERMNSGWRYQFLVVECAEHSSRFKRVSDIGAAEADFNAIIEANDSDITQINLYVSVKNRSNTMGGQD